MTDKPDWLVVGADVVVITYRAGQARETVRRTRVKSVATKFFQLDDISERFSITGQRHSANDYGPYSRVVPADSVEGKQALIQVHRRDAEQRALRAFDEWSRSRTEENRLAAVAALQACAPEEAK